MALPIPSNTTCDIYRAGRAPPQAPDVTGVRIFLAANYDLREMIGEGISGSALRYTHIMLCDVNTDVRDLFGQFTGSGLGDVCWVPDKNGTAFRVHKVDNQVFGGTNAYLRVYLDRSAPTWPTSNL